jgi:RNA polymerase sigma-70 factor (ECF subfamily)
MTDQEILELYDQSVVDVHRAASRLCAGNRAETEELVQDTYLALVRHVRAHPTEVVGVGWLLTACRNRFLDLRRAETRRLRRERAAGAADTLASGASPNDTLSCLAALPEQQRVALVLRYVDDLPVAEVARLLSKSVHATESLLARGRTALRATARLEETA